MTLNVIVGSENPAKIEAVKEAFVAYDLYYNIQGKSAPSGISDQPFSLEEMMSGARNRAVNARGEQDGDLGIGIESGIFQIRSKHFDACHVAIYDGKVFYEGGSPYFEIPDRIVREIKEKKIELGSFFDAKGQGAIGALTKGVVPRKEQSRIAMIIAVARMINKEYK